MATSDLSFTVLIKDIIADIQELFRSEVRLAKAEVSEKVTELKSDAIVIAGGAVLALYAIFFLLSAAVSALCRVMPNWAASLVVAGVLGIGAAVALMKGIKGLKQIHLTPERTVATIKENLP